MKDHGHCEACNLDFKLDFAQSVELIFRVHPAFRSSEVGAYCAGGPAHSPHVIAQVRVAPGERMALNLDLAEGSYRLRGPQLAFTVDFRVHPGARATRWELDLCRGPAANPSRTLKVGGQTFVLANDAEKETIVRVERAAGRADALTAARAASLPLFRKMFPEEVLSAGQLIGVTSLTFLVTASEQASGLYRTLGDNAAFAVINQHLRSLENYIQHESGSVVKTVEEGIVAVFHDTVAAVRVACELQTQMAKAAENSALRLRVGVHRGPALVSTINDRVDYFGSTIKLAMALPRLAGDGEVLLSDAVATDPHVAAWVHGRRIANELSVIHPAGLPDSLVQRLRPQESLAAQILPVHSFE